MKKVLRLIATSLLLSMLITYCIQPVAFAMQDSADQVGTDINVSEIASDESVNDEGDNDESDDEELPDAEEIPYVPMFSLSNDMKSAFITPSVDFYKTEGQDSAITEDELIKLFEYLSSIQLSTVIINTAHDGKSYYNTDINQSTNDDILNTAINQARKSGFEVFLTLDIGNMLSHAKENYDIAMKVDFLASQVHAFATKYKVEGIVATGYYASDRNVAYGDYMHSGAGIGVRNWRTDNSEYLIKTVADVIRRTDNSIAVGMIASHMWANAADTKGGSDTSEDFTALKNGYADTKKYITDKTVDFVILEAKGSVSDGDIPFEKVAKWWTSLCKDNDIPLYIAHSNQKLGTSGWAQDQIIRQLSIARKLDGYKGSAFLSASALKKNVSGSTDALVKFFNDEIDETQLFKELEMVSPKKLTFTTYEPSVTFMGSFDDNFEVYFNEKQIELNEVGNFYFTKDLKVGLNTFTIRHKSKTYTYRITRKVEVLKSMMPKDNIKVDGGTKVEISAISYRDSVVTANINGKSINLSPVGSQSDDIDPNSNYTRFVGTYKVPKGIVEKEQSLGKITIYGSYMGFNESITGGSVTVNALPKPPAGKVEYYDTTNKATGEVVASMTPPANAGKKVKLVRVDKDYPLLADANGRSPFFAQLPKGTIDYYKGVHIEYNSSGGIFEEYYTTRSGKYIPKKYHPASLINGTIIGKNKLNVLSVSTKSGATILKMKLDEKTPFNVEASPVELNSSIAGPHAINDFMATHVKITFDYVTEVTALPSFKNSPMFKSGYWTDVVVNNTRKFQLVLELRQQGIYSGVNCTYDADGNLNFKFTRYVNSLSGAVIVIDPGHGKGDIGAKGTLGPGYYEREMNLQIAKRVEKKLKAKGAKVVRLKTENTNYGLHERTSLARQNNADIFISIHNNSAGANAVGTEAFYFTPFSQPLAKTVCNRVASYWTGKIYTGTKYEEQRKIANRGAKSSRFAVTLQQDFPSILLEVGFVSNEFEHKIINNPKHQDEFAKLIVKGIEDYFGRSSLPAKPDTSAKSATASTMAALPPESYSVSPRNSEETTE